MRVLNNRAWRKGGRVAIPAVALCFAMGLTIISQESRASLLGTSWEPGREQKTTGKPTDPPFVPPQPVSCESFAALVDNALVDWQRMQETHVIFIARLAEGEKASLNKSRLRNVEDYLRRYETLKYVTAEGGRVRGLGQLELYVGGKLQIVIPLKRNAQTVCSGKVNPFL